MDPVFQALADPKRRWYLECLREGDMRLLDLLELFPVCTSTVMHHMRVLEESGLLVSQKEGPARLYSFRREGLEEVSKWLRRLDR